MPRRLTSQEFISKARGVHGSKYNYKAVDYRAARTPVVIICEEHGEFEQRPNDHLSRKSGCPSCAGNKPKDTDTFIWAATEVHGNRYDYTNTVYVNAREPVEIICKKHGAFHQSPDHHIRRGDGCRFCSTSRGEALVADLLDKYNILYEREKRFKNCRDRNTLPFDFYLVTFNICIEYDGEQHYTGWHYDPADLQKTARRDAIKDNFCKQAGVGLIRIPYTKTEIEIENIIQELT